MPRSSRRGAAAPGLLRSPPSVASSGRPTGSFAAAPNSAIGVRWRRGGAPKAVGGTAPPTRASRKRWLPAGRAAGWQHGCAGAGAEQGEAGLARIEAGMKRAAGVALGNFSHYGATGPPYWAYAYPLAPWLGQTTLEQVRHDGAMLLLWPRGVPYEYE